MQIKILSLYVCTFLSLVGSIPSWAIFNGTVVKTHDELSSSVVFIEIGLSSSSCTGTLIEGRYILTAAHCISDRMLFYIQKSKETQNYRINTQNLGKSWIRLEKSKITIHPKASESHINGSKAVLGYMNSIKIEEANFYDYRAHDIAIVELKHESIEELKKHSVKGLAFESLELREDLLDQNSSINVYGYGLSEQYKGLMSQRNTPELRTKKMQPIKDALESNSGYWTFKDQGVIFGDSGGPIFLNDKLIGLVSAGELASLESLNSIKNYFTKFHSQSNADYIVNSMKDFQSFHQQQCEWLKEESLEAVSKASLETSQVSEMTKSMASCNLYEKMCFTGGIFPRDPVLGPCIRASRSFDKRFTEALKLQK